MNDLNRLIERTDALISELTEVAPELAQHFPDLLVDPAAGAAAAGHSVYVLGTIKSGKSTLINALLGQDLMARGAGVKTFNLTRVRHAERPLLTVHCVPGSALRDRLTFDYRLLGFEYELPETLYGARELQAVDEVHRRFEAACAEDQRLAGVLDDGADGGLLERALSRVRRVRQALHQLHDGFPEAAAQLAGGTALIRYGQDALATYARWTESPDLAVVVQLLELGVPFPQTLPAGLELVDCQGSDSLNPLDFADVEGAVRHADLIVYVIASRLGLRQGDRRLLRHLARSGLGSRVLPVLNLEAFSPVPEGELDDLLARSRKELAECLGSVAEPLALNVLAPLLESTGQQEELQLMTMLWRRQTDTGLLERLAAGFDGFVERLQHGPALTGQPDLQAGLEQAMDYCQRALRFARDLLSRDRRMLGAEGQLLQQEERHAAIARTLDGERQKLKALAARTVNGLFDARGPVQMELDALLTLSAREYARQRPVPEGLVLAGSAAPVLDAALAQFNSDWLIERAADRRAALADAQRQVRDALAAGIETIFRLLPVELASPRLEQPETGQWLGRRQFIAGILEEAWQEITLPPVVQPVVLGAASRHSLTAKYHTLVLGDRLQQQLRRTRDRPAAQLAAAAEAGLADKLDKFWRQIQKAALRQARDDRPHAIRNAQENFKYQYFYRIIDRVLDRLAEALGRSAATPAPTAAAASAGMTLVSDEARTLLSDYAAFLEIESRRLQEAFSRVPDAPSPRDTR